RTRRVRLPPANTGRAAPASRIRCRSKSQPHPARHARNSALGRTRSDCRGPLARRARLECLPRRRAAPAASGTSRRLARREQWDSSFPSLQFLEPCRAVRDGFDYIFTYHALGDAHSRGNLAVLETLELVAHERRAALRRQLIEQRQQQRELLRGLRLTIRARRLIRDLRAFVLRPGVRLRVLAAPQLIGRGVPRAYI